jgi:CHAT domain-containing protein
MSSELSPISEPGLALTPANIISENDDGYLSASEIISLDLKAEWVILTACNTFSINKYGENPFAGLASSFLSAGAEGVISTLWPIETISAKNFSIQAVKYFKENKSSRAEALQKAQSKLRTSKNSQWDHPFYWAPYVNIESTIN